MSSSLSELAELVVRRPRVPWRRGVAPPATSAVGLSPIGVDLPVLTDERWSDVRRAATRPRAAGDFVGNGARSPCSCMWRSSAGPRQVDLAVPRSLGSAPKNRCPVSAPAPLFTGRRPRSAPGDGPPPPEPPPSPSKSYVQIEPETGCSQGEPLACP